MKGNPRLKGRYKLIISLGANCSVAHNLLIRGLRPCSLPFDWTYMLDCRPMEWMVGAVRRRFSDFCRKENLREMRPGDPDYNGSHTDRKQYFDRVSGFRFVNHFTKSIDDAEEWKTVRGRLDRRIGRLVSCLESGGDFLLVLSTHLDVPLRLLEDLRGELVREFPVARFDVCYLHFSSSREKISRDGHVLHYEIPRAYNEDDFNRTNREWGLFDGMKVTFGVKSPKTGFFGRAVRLLTRILNVPRFRKIPH